MRLVIILLTIAAFGQQGRKVTLSWTDSQNPAGTTYSIYRAAGICSGSPVFSKIATGLTAKTYIDQPVAPGNYCYAATATAGGMESGQSVGAQAAVSPFAPIDIQIVIQ